MRAIAMKQSVATLFLLIIVSWRPVFAEPQDKLIYPKGSHGWRAIAPPKYESPLWWKANHSTDEWTVSRQSNHIAIKRRDSNEPEQPTLPFTIQRPKGTYAPYLVGLRYIAKVDNGWLVGFNAGEWGGTLWWFSPDGKKRYMISKDQVCGFLPSRVGLLALEGLGHLGLSRGKIIRLRKLNGRWATERFVDLGSAPYVAIQDVDGSIIVATSAELLRVQLNKKKTVLLSGSSWSGTYPNSMVRAPSGNLYLGMRYAVVKITRNKSAYKAQWLIPNAA
jgi:hypothetical protein